MNLYGLLCIPIKLNVISVVIVKICHPQEHKKCTNLQKSVEESNKELNQLKQQHSFSRVDQCTQTNQSNSCNCDSSSSTKSANEDPNELEALKKYHEDLEGTVSQLEVNY